MDDLTCDYCSEPMDSWDRTPWEQDGWVHGRCAPAAYELANRVTWACATTGCGRAGIVQRVAISLILDERHGLGDPRDHREFQCPQCRTWPEELGLPGGGVYRFSHPLDHAALDRALRG